MRNVHALLFPALLGVSLTASACADLSGDEAVGETASALSVSSWASFLNGMAFSWRGTQIATLNGVTYGVNAGSCGQWDCWPYQDENSLTWEVLGSNGLWTQLGTIPNESANTKVSLAAFNGYLYMVHTGSDDNTQTWISRMDPATRTWTPDYQVSLPTFGGTPAIVAFNGLLYFIGTSDYPYSMWYATMTPGEVISGPQPIPHHDSASRPSAAVLNGTLYFAHRWGSTADIVYGTFDGTASPTAWSDARHIPGGDAGGTLRGLEPAIAVDNNILHLVHLRTEGTNYVWWTYFDGCNWAGTEVTIASKHSDQPPSLTQSSTGLQLTTAIGDAGGFGVEEYSISSSAYTRPFTRIPPVFPGCGPIVIGPSR
jgi:hypothetical protein